MPVDWYNGGMEHTTLHLLYSRFWHRFLYDEGVVPCPEPYQKRTSHGMILGENGEKMSKSRGNVINPDDIVAEIGADAFRLYEMFMGAFDQPIPWSTDGARGCYRFLERVWKLQKTVTDEKAISKKHERAVNVAIKKVSEDYEKMKYNTAIAAMMGLVNEFYAANTLSAGDLGALLKLLYPVCPHFAEEMWTMLELGDGYIHEQPWPVCDESKLVADEVEIAVQILGKIKARINVPSSLGRDELAAYVLENETVKQLVEGRTVRKVIAVPGSLVNIIC
jgi:leucyl-tRNA synthetase